MADGFLGRWSRRKTEIKEGKKGEVAPLPSPQPSPASGRGGEDPGIAPSPLRGEGGGEGCAESRPPPSLDDVKALTRDSDFSRFAAPDVAPHVRNAAMKKLFSDPRYNVMDGMDVYVGDYSKPDPIPHAMLRELASAKFLGLFDAEDKAEAQAAAPEDVPDAPPQDTVARGESAPEEAAQPAAPDGEPK